MESLNPKHFFLSRSDSSLSGDIVHEEPEIKTFATLLSENKGWLFKQIYKFLRRYRVWIRILLTLILVLGFAVISSMSYKTGFYQGIEEWEKLSRTVHSLKRAINEFQLENQSLKQERTTLLQQQAIKETEYYNMLTQLKKLTLENAELKEDKLLYQSVMEKPQQNKILALKKFHLYPSDDQNHFRYQLLLTSLMTQKKLLQGDIVMAISGKIEGRVITLPVRYLPEPVLPQQLRFKFKQFQELSGTLTLPSGFQPKMMILNVVVNSQPHIKIEKRMPWVVES